MLDSVVSKVNWPLPLVTNTAPLVPLDAGRLSVYELEIDGATKVMALLKPALRATELKFGVSLTPT
jgi:hypothetical protein